MYYSSYQYRVTTGDNKDFFKGAGLLCDLSRKLCMLPAGGKLYCRTMIKSGDMTPNGELTENPLFGIYIYYTNVANVVNACVLIKMAGLRPCLRG